MGCIRKTTIYHVPTKGQHLEANKQNVVAQALASGLEDQGGLFFCFFWSVCFLAFYLQIL